MRVPRESSNRCTSRRLCHKHVFVMQAGLPHRTRRRPRIIHLAPKTSTDQLPIRPATQNRPKAACAPPISSASRDSPLASPPEQRRPVASTPYTFKTPPRAVKPHGLRTGDASNIEEAPDPVTHRRTRSLRPSALTLVSCVPGSMQKASGGEHSPCGEPQASAGEARPLVSTCRCSAAPLWRAFG